MHIYHSSGLAERQNKELFRLVESYEETLSQLKELTRKEVKRYSAFFDIKQSVGGLSFSRNYDKIDKSAKNHGFFCLLSNSNRNSGEALLTYRRRDMIEKEFDDLKNHLDMFRLRTHSGEITEGKMFCAFISLIAISKINAVLRKNKDMVSMSKKKLITEMEKIKIIKLSASRRLMNPLTKSQRVILDLFGYNEESIKSYILGAK
jgi:transposase